MLYTTKKWDFESLYNYYLKSKEYKRNWKLISSYVDGLILELNFSWKLNIDLNNDLDKYIYYNILKAEKRPADVLPF